MGWKSALLNLSSEFAQLLTVRASVVPAEQQLAPGREQSANLGSSPAAVAAVGSGQLGAGECCSHDESPSVPATELECSGALLPSCDHSAPGRCAVLAGSTLTDVLAIVSVPVCVATRVTMRFTRLQQAYTCICHRFTVLTRTERNRKPAGGAAGSGHPVGCVRPGV